MLRPLLARRYKLQRTLTGHTRSIVSVKFSSAGALLASGAADKTVRIWNADTGDLIRVLEGHTQVRPSNVMKLIHNGNPKKAFSGCLPSTEESTIVFIISNQSWPGPTIPPLAATGLRP